MQMKHYVVEGERLTEVITANQASDLVDRTLAMIHSYIRENKIPTYRDKVLYINKHRFIEAMKQRGLTIREG